MSGEVRLERHYAVAIEKVWRAWTDPQALSQWFGAGPQGVATQAQIDLRVGGQFRIVTTLRDGGTNEVSGHYETVEAPRRLVFSWAWRSTPERVSRVSLDLIARDGGTTLRFVHDQFFDAPARDSHERGWTTLFEQLDAHLQTHGGH